LPVRRLYSQAALKPSPMEFAPATSSTQPISSARVALTGREPPRRAGCRAMAAAASAPRAGWPRTAPAARHALATPVAHHAGRALRRPSWPHCRGRRAGRAGPPSRCHAEATPTQGPRARAEAAPAQGPRARAGAAPRPPASGRRGRRVRPSRGEGRGEGGRGRAASRERERDVRGIGEGEKEVGERGWG
jgi:hypothetical protein